MFRKYCNFQYITTFVFVFSALVCDAGITKSHSEFIQPAVTTTSNEQSSPLEEQSSMNEAELKKKIKKAKSGDPDAANNLCKYYFDKDLDNPERAKKLENWCAVGSKKFVESKTLLALLLMQSDQKIKQSKATDLLVEAANEDPRAQFILGSVLLLSKESTDEQRNTAINYLEAANSKGFAPATSMLAGLYFEGLIVAKDETKAIALYEVAADHGEATAQLKLGQLYEKGNSVPKNFEKAFSYFKSAAEQGDAESQWYLGQAYEKRGNTPENLANALDWYKKSAAQKHTEAEMSLALFYYDPKFPERNFDKAIEYAELANQEESVKTKLLLSSLKHLLDQSTEQTKIKSKEFLKNAIDNFHFVTDLDICESMAIAYTSNTSREAALKWCEDALAAGNKIAAFHMGILYNYKTAPETETAFKYFKIAADTGFTEAEMEVATSYYYGRGAERNYPLAIEWATKAAKKGSGFAAYLLGSSAQYGNGREKNYVDALNWYTKAVAKNVPAALDSIAYLYYAGLGTPQNFDKSFEYYKSAAALHYVDAEFHLANMYFDGLGTPKDLQQSFYWMELAARHQQPYSKIRICDYYLNGWGTSQDSEKAVQILEAEVKNNNSIAQYRLGYYLLNGKFVTKDSNRALELLTKASHQNNRDAQLLLGQSLIEGKDVPQNFEQGISLLTEASNAAFAPAQSYLGWLNQKGKYLPQNISTALSLYQLSAAQGYAPAQINLADFYLQGKHVKRDEKYAFSLVASASKNNCWGMKELGEYYRFGFGTPIDIPKAINAYISSFKSGCDNALLNLGSLYASNENGKQNKVLALLFYKLAEDKGIKVSPEAHENLEATQAQIEEAHRLAAEWSLDHPIPTTSEAAANASSK